MRKYLARNFVAAHITDAAGMAQPVDLRDHQGVSLLSGAGPVPPRIAGSLPDLLLTAGGNEVRIDLTPLFAGASSYSVTPMPAGVTLDDAILAIDPLDEIAPIQIGVRGVNAAGASNPVQFMLTVSMSAPEIVGPTAVTLSSIARTVQADTALPLILAALAADGTAPLTWALTAGAPHAEIDISAQPPRLMLAQMPAVGAQAITVRASNSAGQATASFDLTVEAAVIDPPSEIVVSIAGNPDTVTSGQSLTGTITGAPAGATIQHRWTDGTAPYVGATAATFIPVIGAGGISDLSPVYYEPIIDGAAYRSDRVDVIHAAPIASGSMPDLTMTQGDATATGDASTYFSGQALIYEIEGVEASITSSGVWSVSANTVRSGAVVVITARNSGGSVTRAFAVDVVALQVGALTITPSTLIDASVAAAPYPATYQMDGPAGATGVLLFFHHMGSWVGAIDIDGQPATRIGSAPSTRFSTGATESVCEVFYSASVSGSVTVSGGPSGVRAVVAGHITGGTLRSFELQTYTTPVADGDGGTAKVAHTYEGAGRQHDLSIFGIIGDQQAILSPPHSRIANWTGSFGAVDGAVFVSPLIADGDFTLQTNNHNGYRQRYGSWLLVASQYPQDRVVTDPPPIERYVYPLRQADLSRADVPVSGTYTGVAATLEIRVVDGDGAGLTDWQAVTGVSGAWTATVTVPRPAAATAMHVETRFAGGDRSWVQGDPWTIGLHLAEMGQSNKSGELLGGGGADVVARPGFGMLYSTATGTFVPGGKGWWAFCNTFTDLTGVPVLGVYSTQDGSPASAFIPGTVQYANLRAGVASLDSPIHAFRWHQGEGDAATARADQYPVSQYYGHLAAIRDQIAADTGRASGDDLPIIVEGLSTYGGASPTTDQRWTNMQRTLADIAGTIPGGVFGNCRTDLVRADTYHAYGASFATTSAPRSAYEVARALGLLSGPSTTDFRIASASATNATTTTINVQHGPGSAMAIVGLGHGNGTGLVTEGLTSAPSAFEVWDGAAWIAATATITGAATISLDHASIPTAGRRIRHLHGMDPCSDGLIRDDSAYHSPLMMTHDLACT